MDRAPVSRPFWALRAGSISAVIAGMLAIAMFASSTPTTNAVEQAPAATTAEAAYFPAQFPDMDGEVTPHIEAF